MIFTNLFCCKHHLRHLSLNVINVNAKLLAISQFAVLKLKYLGVVSALEFCFVKIDLFNVISIISVEILSNISSVKSEDSLNEDSRAERACSLNRLFSRIALVIITILWGMNTPTSQSSLYVIFLLTCISLTDVLAELVRLPIVFYYMTKWSSRLSQGFQNRDMTSLLKDCFRFTSRSLFLAKLEIISLFIFKFSFFVLMFYFFFMAHLKMDLALLLLGLFFRVIGNICAYVFYEHCDSLTSFDKTLAGFNRDGIHFMLEENLLSIFLNKVKQQKLQTELCNLFMSYHCLNHDSPV